MSPTTRRALHRAERRVTSWPVHLWRFWTAPLTDKPDYDLSLTRLLAVGIFFLVWHAIEAAHEVSVNMVVLLILVMAAAFGKATFTFFLSKWHGESTSADTTNVTHATSATIDEKITHDIQERRGDRTYEPTP